MLLTTALALPMGGHPPLTDAAVPIDREWLAPAGLRDEVMVPPQATGI